jgi:hypothetical protein
VAIRGSKKARSVAHEDWIAKLYAGKRSPSSGGAFTDAGDVRTTDQLIECKTDMPTTTNAERKPKIVKQMEKIADEAWQEGREPVLALRLFQPDSVLASPEGYVDLTVRLTRDDAYRDGC